MTPLERAWRGGRRDWRLHMLSVFSVSVAFVCLAAALLVVVNVQHLRDAWARAGRASVFLSAGATADQIREIEAALRRTPGVADVRHVTGEQARRELVGSTNDAVLDQLPTEAFPASLEIVLENDARASRLEALKTQLSALPAVEAVQTYEAWTERLGTLLGAGVAAAILLTAVVLGAVVSVVGSTMRLSLQRRRIEVEVLKLVGATDGYVRKPFVIEGAAQGAFGAVMATVLLAALYLIVTSRFDTELALLVGVTPTFLPWTLVMGLVLVGGVLGAVAAYGSLRRLLIV